MVTNNDMCFDISILQLIKIDFTCCLDADMIGILAAIKGITQHQYGVYTKSINCGKEYVPIEFPIELYKDSTVVSTTPVSVCQ
jgi:hypothetical protein